jgi:hypothetical protein
MTCLGRYIAATILDGRSNRPILARFHCWREARRYPGWNRARLPSALDGSPWVVGMTATLAAGSRRARNTARWRTTIVPPAGEFGHVGAADQVGQHEDIVRHVPFSAANSWRITSPLPLCRRNRSASHADNPSSRFDRDIPAHGCQPPHDSHRFTVFREQPSSVAIRFDPHPSSLSLIIAATSSGAFISVLRGSSIHREPSISDSI